MRKYIMRKFHETHKDIIKTQKKCKQLFYQPDLNKAEEQLIGECTTCLRFSYSKQKEPMLQHKIPTLPFQKISLDIAETENSNYLIVMDYYSRWLEVASIKNKIAETVIKILKMIFIQLEIPKEVVSDNNPYESRN